MTAGTPAKLILLFSLPLIVGNIFQQFYSMADTVIVGRTIGVNALAAVGCTGSISFFILGFVMGFTSGLSIITAQRFGAQDEEGVKRSFAVSIILSTLLTILMTALSLILVRPMMSLLQTPPEIMEDAISYIRIIFWGIGASVLFNLASNTMRALGDSKNAPLLSDFCLLHQYRAGSGIYSGVSHGCCRRRCSDYFISAAFRYLLFCIYQ